MTEQLKHTHVQTGVLLLACHHVVSIRLVTLSKPIMEIVQKERLSQCIPCMRRMMPEKELGISGSYHFWLRTSLGLVSSSVISSKKIVRDKV